MYFLILQLKRMESCIGSQNLNHILKQVISIKEAKYSNFDTLVKTEDFTNFHILRNLNHQFYLDDLSCDTNFRIKRTRESYSILSCIRPPEVVNQKVRISHVYTTAVSRPNNICQISSGVINLVKRSRHSPLFHLKSRNLLPCIKINSFAPILQPTLKVSRSERICKNM